MPELSVEGIVSAARIAAANLKSEMLFEFAAERAGLLARIAELEAQVPPKPVTTRCLMGMSTEDNLWDERVALTGPVNSRRVFSPMWNIPDLIRRVTECHQQGLVPIASMKSRMTKTDSLPTNWQAQIGGSWDSRFVELAKSLDALDFQVWYNQDHEPRGGTVKSPLDVKPWADARARQWEVMRGEMGESSKVLVGTCDNGHPWGLKYGNLSDADLGIYYTKRLLAACQYLAGDFYDGATDTNPGEPAWIKFRNFQEWTERIGFTGPLGAGEWNFVAPQDALDLWPIIQDPRWAFAELFNNSANNRTNLPTSINGSWVLTPGSERLKAYRTLLDMALPERS